MKMITMSNKKTVMMMMMMIVKVILLLLLSIDLFSSCSSAVVVSTDNNNDIDNYYQHEQHGIDIVNQKQQQGGLVDIDDDTIIMNDMMMTQEPNDDALLSSSSLLNQRMMMKKHQIIKSKNHLLLMNNGNNNNIISTKQQQQMNYNNRDQQKDITGSYVRNDHSDVTTMNRFSLLDDVMIQNEIEDFESIHRMMIINDTARCVKNQKGIEMMIRNAPEYSLQQTNINICKDSIINIDGSTLNNVTGFSGIHIMNKFLNFRCHTKCFLDARRKSRHFYIKNSTILFNNITFINGNEIFNNEKNLAWGGSLHIDSSDIVINKCNFFNNNIKDDLSYANGGAVYCLDSNIKLFDVNMINNSASGYGYGYGGAVYSEMSNLKMANVSFINNKANYWGGAVVTLGETLEMKNATFTNNSVLDPFSYGGAISSLLSTILLNSVVFTSNTAGYAGGAMSMYGDYVNITNSTFQSNNAGEIGGAISCGDSTILLNSAVFESNYARNGTIALANSKVEGLKDNTKFSKSNMEVYDVFVFTFTQDFEYRPSKSNFPLSPPPKQAQTKQESIVTIAIQSSPGQQSRKKCVTTYSALRRQVLTCNNTLNMDPCIIDICRAQIEMITTVRGSRPINLSNKNLTINCKVKNGERCMIDGKGLSRIFYGSNVAVTFRNIIFSNGYSSTSGGAFDLTGSFVNLFNCSFMNNFAKTGTAIMIKDTVFYMTGTESSFINNTGDSPALVGYSSELELYDTLFEGNKGTEYGKGLFLFHSAMTIYNTTFSELKKTTDNDCNIFVAVDSNNFTNEAICID